MKNRTGLAFIGITLALLVFMFAASPSTLDAPMTQTDVISLREYVDLRFSETQRAVEKAQLAMESRLSSMNEFRDSLKDAQSTYITRTEILGMLTPMQDDIRLLRTIADKAEGKASQTGLLITAFMSAIGLAVSLFRITTPRITRLRNPGRKR